MIPTRQQAEELLMKYNKEPFHIEHGKTVSAVLGIIAQKEDPENAEYWSIVGLLHDIDYEMYPDEHCIKSFEIFKEEGIDESFAKSVASHCYGLAEGRDIKPEHIMEKYLFAVDELTGLIGAAARMRPSKSCSDMELKSLMKKYKSPSFAAGCSREVIARGAEMLGLSVEELCDITLNAMKKAGY